ncbi:MAG: hypothetical protein GXY19_13630 [Phycisphaerae bacterium]|nr:hypothetical protein [Phycisphaerae bacterium]
MNERRDERWLDEQLRRAINTTAPEFDAERWKRDHAEAYQALVARGQGVKGVKVRRVQGVYWAGSALAAAAVILVGVAILVTPPQVRDEPVGVETARAPSAAHIVSMISLRTAYRQGGEDALYEQLDAALKTLGPRPDASSTPLLFGRL